jgi:transcriptional regulator GlxA family with amidase domain
MLIVAIFFEPGGLHRLLGIPMHELFDDSLDASLIWNKEITQLEQRLRETANYDLMKQLIEAFLLAQLNRKQVEKHPIDMAFRLLQDTTRPLALDYLADQACLSPRQFERKCHERLGLGPKTFNRIARFSKAFRLKEHRPDLTWLEVALLCGYYDTQHLRRDFKEFGASTPTLLLQEETRNNVRGYSSHDF